MEDYLINFDFSFKNLSNRRTSDGFEIYVKYKNEDKSIYKSMNVIQFY